MWNLRTRTNERWAEGMRGKLRNAFLTVDNKVMVTREEGQGDG